MNQGFIRYKLMEKKITLKCSDLIQSEINTVLLNITASGIFAFIF